MGARICREIKTQEVSIPFSKQFLKKDSLGFIMVCNIGGQLGTKMVISALGMLALYMRLGLAFGVVRPHGFYGGHFEIDHNDQLLEKSSIGKGSCQVKKIQKSEKNSD